MSGPVFKRGPIFVPEADLEPFDPLAPRWHRLPLWLRWLVDPVPRHHRPGVAVPVPAEQVRAADHVLVMC